MLKHLLIWVIAGGAVLGYSQAKTNGAVNVKVVASFPIGPMSALIHGQINLAAGSIQAETSLTGTATLDSTIQHQAGLDPLGSVDLEAKGFDFHATKIDSVKIKDNVLTVEGDGDVNSKSDYKFVMLVSQDVKESDKSKVRLRIYTKAHHIVVFDNQPNTKPDAALGDGTIVKPLPPEIPK
jgi:hypothetical protein